MPQDLDVLMARTLGDELRAQLRGMRGAMQSFKAKPLIVRPVLDARNDAHTIASSATILSNHPLMSAGKLTESMLDMLAQHIGDPSLLDAWSANLDDLDYLVSCLASGDDMLASAEQRAHAMATRNEAILSRRGTAKRTTELDAPLVFDSVVPTATFATRTQDDGSGSEDVARSRDVEPVTPADLPSSEFDDLAKTLADNVPAPFAYAHVVEAMSLEHPTSEMFHIDSLLSTAPGLVEESGISLGANGQSAGVVDSETTAPTPPIPGAEDDGPTRLIDQGISQPTPSQPSVAVRQSDDFSVDLSLLPLDGESGSDAREVFREEGLATIQTGLDQLTILADSPDDVRAVRDLLGVFEAIAGAAGFVGRPSLETTATSWYREAESLTSEGQDELLDALPVLREHLDELAQLVVMDEPRSADGDRSTVKAERADAQGLASVSPAADIVEHHTTSPQALPSETAIEASRERESTLVAMFVEETTALLVEARNALIDLPSAARRPVNCETLLRCFHTIAGAAGMLGQTQVNSVAGTLEAKLEILRGEQFAGIDAHAAAVGAGIEQIETLIERLQSPSSETVSGIESNALRQFNQLAGAATLDDTTQRQDFVPMQPAFPDDVFEGLSDDQAEDEIRRIFLEEARELLSRLNLSLIGLEENRANTTLLQDVRRSSHTLKGAASTTGFTVIADLCHAMENVLDSVSSGAVLITDRLLTVLFDSSQELEVLVNLAAAGKTSDPEPVATLKMRLMASGEELTQETDALPEPVDDPRRDVMHPESAHRDAPKSELSLKRLEQHTGPEPEFALLPAFTKGDSGGLFAAESSLVRDEAFDTGGDADGPALAFDVSNAVRVDIPRLDAIINLVGELVINRSAFEQHIGQFRQSLHDMSFTLDRLRRLGLQLSKTYEAKELIRADHVRTSLGGGQGARVTRSGEVDEFDPLQMDRYTELHLLARELTESIADAGTVERELRLLSGQFASLNGQQGRLSRELQERLLQVRLVRLEALFGRVYRAGRDLARRQNKEVRIRTIGRDVEVDKTIIEGLNEALLHLIRNAIDHGIETLEVRRALGKPSVASVTCQAFREGNEVVIQVRDDGSGIDPEHVYAQALHRGLVPGSASLTTEEKLDLIFLQGVSTRTSVTDVSGRGVGLDVVSANVKRLHGRLQVETAVGVGTVFIIRLPVTLAIMRALLLECGDHTFAVPAAAANELARVAPKMIKRIGRQATVRIRDEVYQLHYLTDLLAMPRQVARPDDDIRVMLMHTAHGDRAIVADRFLVQQDIVVKQLPRHLRRIRGVTGATILGDGRVVLILDPAQLVGASADTSKPTIGTTNTQQQTANLPRYQDEPRQLLAMVVDDSLSIRRIVGNVLEKEGFRVVQAKDGLEALELFQGNIPDVLILDIEMPRMDGFELAATMRRNASLASIPIAFLTSRAGDVHRDKAHELGASAFLTKPCPDHTLVATARRLATASAFAEVQ